MKKLLKRKLPLQTFLFLAFLAAMLLGLLLPKPDFSENEKRFLARFPVPTAASVTSGAWGADLETWLADHIPARDWFVGLNAYYEKLLGLQPTKEIRTVAGRLVEAPAANAPDTVARNLQVVNRFAQMLDQPVYLALVPSCGWALGQPDYPDEALIAVAESEAGPGVALIHLEEVFRGRPELYYKTDHHWTSAGAWAGCQALMQALNRTYAPEDYFRKEVHPDCFRGSTYSRSALWLTEPEDLELWYGTPEITAQNRESGEIHEGVFYPERLSEADKYTVFLDGNHSLVTLRNPEKTGRLLVIRDSYSNCLGCFLAESYGEVVLADLRYYKSPVSALVQEGFDDILVCYSIGNFMTDGNLALLR